MSEVAFTAYNGKEIALPSGRKVAAKPIGYRDAIRVLELLSKFRAGAGPMEETIGVLGNEFPGMIGLSDGELLEFTLAEFLDLVNDFLAYSRRPKPKPAPAQPTTPPA